jgi:hypothetical protein
MTREQGVERGPTIFNDPTFAKIGETGYLAAESALGILV